MENPAILIQYRNEKEKSNAFSSIVRTYQERLYWHIRKMVLQHDDANDVLQNTFLKAWNGLDNFRGDSQLSTWLYKIATNETITFLTAKRSKQKLLTGELEETMFKSLKADSYFNGDEVQLKLQKAILSLPEKQRLVFNMRFYDDLPYEQISEIVGTSVGALKASYHHAAKKVENFMMDETED